MQSAEDQTFAVSRDFSEEIAQARRSLWPKYKELGQKIVIVYPATLIHNGTVISGMFPNWSKIMHGRRLDGHSRSERTMSAYDKTLKRESGAHPLTS